jgi:hypothetical protein
MDIEMNKRLFSFTLLLSVLFFINNASAVLRHYNSSNINTGFGLGIDYATYQPYESTFNLMVTYNTSNITAALGGSYQRNRYQPSGNTANWLAIRAHVGLRYFLYSKLFFTYGIVWGYAFDTGDPYAIGPYVGLDYYLIYKLFLSFKIAPYLYSRQWDSSTRSSFFETGSIGLTYTF